MADVLSRSPLNNEDMHSFCETAEVVYVPTWHRVLVGWLGWSDSRFNAWLAAWQSDLSANDSLFYHWDEWHYILPLLVHDKLATELAEKRTRERHNDLQYLLDTDLNEAIRGLPLCYPINEPEFDWDLARRRANDCLQTYGHTIPDASYVTAYEHRILNRGH